MTALLSYIGLILLTAALTQFGVLIGLVTFLVSMYLLIGTATLIKCVARREQKKVGLNFAVAEEQVSHQVPVAEAIYSRPEALEQAEIRKKDLSLVAQR